MGLDLWFREDVQRVLTALLSANNRKEPGERQRGYEDALFDLALAFGVVVPGAAARGDETHQRGV